VIALVEGSAELRDALRASGVEIVECASGRGFDSAVARRRADLDAVVIGARVTDPIQTASRVYRLDAQVGVVILGEDRPQCEHISGALRFAPLIGSDVACIHGPLDEMVSKIAAAAARTRSRRSHRQTLAAIQSAASPEPRSQPRNLSEHYAAHLIDFAPVGILATDDEHRIIGANLEAARLLGTTERAMLGRRLGSEEIGADGGAWGRLLAMEVDGGNAPPMRFVRRIGGASRWIEARANAISGDGNRVHLVVFSDVTERVTLDEERRLALARAEESSRLKDELIAVVSHELRTPLTAIIGWTRLLRLGRVAPDRVAHALQTIEQKANAQALLIGDLLDFSRIATGKMRLDLRPTHLVDVIDEAIEALEPAANAKQIRFERVTEMDGDLRIVADRERLQQVMWNLMSNAVKFSHRGAVIDVTLRRIERTVEITVVDRGEGIDSEVLPFVFDPFRQADGGATRVHGGLGLGLAIVRRLVELHGGTVTAASEGPDRGAMFTVRLPATAPAPAAAPGTDRARSARPMPRSEPGVYAALEGASVLVVDDDADERDLLADVFAGAGAVVATAGSVEGAKAALARARPSLIVSDIGAGSGGSEALIAHVRAHHGQTPAIQLTAYGSRVDRAKSARVGFDAHATKPIDPFELLALAARLLVGRDCPS
jgi:PAS domain S-box-containing protein